MLERAGTPCALVDSECDVATATRKGRKTGQVVEHIRPNFDRPPLVEQAIVAVFEPIEGFTIVDYGLFWSEVQADFPIVDTTDPVSEQIEWFDQIRTPDPTLQLLARLPLPRAMFRDAAGGELIQLQPGRFGFNWSKVENDHYPRSEVVMNRFQALFSRFQAYVSSRGLGAVRLRQCELTNLNIIPVKDFGKGYEDITNAIKVDPLDLGVSFLRAETFTRSRQHRILAEDGSPVGRLHTAIAPVISTQDGEKAFRLEFTARSAPNVVSDEAMKNFFAIARSAINSAFCATVTDNMKQLWGEQT